MPRRWAACVELPHSPAAPASARELSSPRDAQAALADSRKALVEAAAGVDEETFYRLGGGGQEYSVVSVLENVHQHDEEHRSQIERIRALNPLSVSQAARKPR